jgi:hypothetical protein
MKYLILSILLLFYSYAYAVEEPTDPASVHLVMRPINEDALVDSYLLCRRYTAAAEILYKQVLNKEEWAIVQLLLVPEFESIIGSRLTCLEEGRAAIAEDFNKMGKNGFISLYVEHCEEKD